MKTDNPLDVLVCPRCCGPMTLSEDPHGWAIDCPNLECSYEIDSVHPDDPKPTLANIAAGKVSDKLYDDVSGRFLMFLMRTACEVGISHAWSTLEGADGLLEQIQGLMNRHTYVTGAPQPPAPIVLGGTGDLVCRRCGCAWRDNLDGTVSLWDGDQTPCSVCEDNTAEACRRRST